MILRQEIQQFASGYFPGKPVLKAYLFGSFARGEADNDSDVDVLIELDYEHEGYSFSKYCLMANELEAAFGKKVDLVSSDGISKYIAPYIHSDKVLIYER